MFRVDLLNSKPVHAGADSVVVGQVFSGSDGSDCWATVVDVFHGNVTNVFGSDVLGKKNMNENAARELKTQLTSIRFSSS